VAALDDVGAVSVELVWDPPWSPERMSDDARLALEF
jgi:metal-sulfur cluster biosynthetic enzyme